MKPTRVPAGATPRERGGEQNSDPTAPGRGGLGDEPPPFEGTARVEGLGLRVDAARRATDAPDTRERGYPGKQPDTRQTGPKQ